MKNLSFRTIFALVFGIVFLVAVPLLGIALMAAGVGIFFARRANNKAQDDIEYHEAYWKAAVKQEREFILACKSMG